MVLESRCNLTLRRQRLLLIFSFLKVLVIDLFYHTLGNTSESYMHMPNHICQLSWMPVVLPLVPYFKRVKDIEVRWKENEEANLRTMM